jgi:spore coat polysaccharide biosynthesis predicted glycosyltransferase SpsG/RimJ/RimL family protein N-acetyltransferase
MVNKSKPNIILQGRGDQQIGFGHLSRLLAVGQILCDLFEVYLVTADIPESLSFEYKKSSITVYHYPDTSYEDQLRILNTEHLIHEGIFILDGYEFTEAYVQKLRLAFKVILINDIPEEAIDADVILNHGIGIERKDFNASIKANLFLGPRYAILRRQFLEFNSNISASSGQLFLSLGGASTMEQLKPILESLNLNPRIEACHVVLPFSVMNEPWFKDCVLQSRYKIKPYFGLSANEMITLMAQCSVGITTASTLSYEFHKINPKARLYILKTVDNQARLYDGLLNAKVAQKYPIDHRFNADHTSIQLPIIDQHVSTRIRLICHILLGDLTPFLQKAALADIWTAYDWANLPEVRQSSINQGSISVDTHKSWYAKKIESLHSDYFIFKDGQNAIGQVRLERQDETTVEISYLLDPAFRGMGLSTYMLTTAMATILNQKAVVFRALVKPENIASMKVFEKLKFTRQADEWISNTQLAVFNHKKLP